MNMSRKGDAGEVLAVIGIVIGIILILVTTANAGYTSGERSVQEKAIKEGVGEYYTPDPTKPNLEFRFKVPAPLPEAH